MDAAIYNLADIRSARNTAMLTAASYPMPADWAGLALQSALMLHNATLFWVEYGRAMLSCHVQLTSGASLPCSKPPSRPDKPSNWL
ncbi:MAG: hypothetical protein A2Y38_14715 [Spirochaetes bacterium GWB1_59_5]|nr:MAG: hypothetical protein A2Y38_14715 [Spirochaetes bacterium GWB1_59_5]